MAARKKSARKKSKRHPGLAKARKVRSLMAKGYSKTEARKRAGVKGARKTRKRTAKRRTKRTAKRRTRR